MKKRIQLLLGATLIVFMGLGQAFGQVSLATDNASNYGGTWVNGDNEGTGFGTWSLSSSGSGGNYIGDTGLPGTDTSFGIYAGGGTGSDPINELVATRNFSSQIDINHTISFDFGHTGIESGGEIGFTLYSGGSYRMNFKFVGGETVYKLNDGGSDFSSGISYAGGSTISVSITRLSGNNYALEISDGTTTYSASSNTATSGSFAIDRIDFYSKEQGPGHNVGFNNLSIKGGTLKITGSAGFRLMSSPVTTSYSDILDEIWTQGASSGADATNGDPNVFGWKWNVLSPEWETLTNLSANISTGIGFLVYVFADDDYDGSADAFPKTLSVSGTEHSGNVEPNINTDNDVYQLFGNPYASTIDFDDITKTNLTNVAYVWDPNAGGSGEWETWNGTTGDLTDGLIAPFQGFFIQTASSGTPDITITEASKSSNGSFLGKAIEEPQKIRFEVEGNGLSNSAFLQFGINGSSTEKVIGDAEELTSLSSSFAQLSFSKADGLFDIANIGNPTEEVTIPLDFTSSTGGIFTLSATDFDVSSNYDLTFHDYKTGESLIIDESFRYSFETQRLKPQEVPVLTSLTAWAIKAKSSEGNRFGITIAPGTSVSIDDEIDAPTEFTLGQNYPNPFNPTTNINYSVGEAGPVNITVYNTMGQKVAELLNTTKSAGSYQITWNATGVASGIYYYRLTAPGQVLTRQMTLIK